jgi:CTP:molybdopterin cytidylyltransferase MocA
MARGYNAIVLAGGASTRMGEPKALVEVGGRALLEHHLALLADASTVVVVTGPHHGLIAALVAELDASKVLLALNGDVESGPFVSLRLGLLALGRARRPVVVLPVDVPPLAGLDVAALVEAASAPGVVAALASHAGRDGHPVVLAPAGVAAVQSAPADSTLRDVLAAAGAAVVRVPTSVAAVLADLDTPADLARHRSPTPS